MAVIACRANCVHRKVNGYNCTLKTVLIKQDKGIMICSDFKPIS